MEALKLTPEGRAPLSTMDGAGKPVAVTPKEPALPTVKVVAAALVIDGGSPTVRVKVCCASLPMRFDAVKCSG